MTTNKTSSFADTSDDLRAEYDLDYARSRPNRFAPKMRGTVVAVALEPDVAAVFDTSEAVNRALRSVISERPAGDPHAGQPDKNRGADHVIENQKRPVADSTVVHIGRGAVTRRQR